MDSFAFSLGLFTATLSGAAAAWILWAAGRATFARRLGVDRWRWGLGAALLGALSGGAAGAMLHLFGGGAVVFASEALAIDWRNLATNVYVGALCGPIPGAAFAMLRLTAGAPR